MSLKLNVFLNQTLTGELSIDAQNNLSFHYLTEYRDTQDNPPLSQSLPLEKISFDATACRPFFSGILPEENLRRAIARKLGISEKNDFALLSAIGGECAGAVSLLPAPSKPSDLIPSYQVIDDDKVADILQAMHQKPMLVGEDGIRLSLAGAQDKLAVAIIDGQLAIPVGGAPSTHIIKPVNRDFPSLIDNELFCLQLAKKIGLNVASASMAYAGDIPYLLVKRYDRIETEQGIQRLHQEDFCQAMSIMPEMKYQREGGPQLAACFQLLRESCSLPARDIKALLQGVIFNLLIGNNDAHGKNFSLLYLENQTCLAPFYDMISTIHYPSLATKMAMKIGSKYDFDTLFPRHIMQMAEQAKLSKSLVKKEVLAMIIKMRKHINQSPYSEGILQRLDKLEQRFA